MVVTASAIACIDSIGCPYPYRPLPELPLVDKPDDVSAEVIPVPGGVVLRYSVAPSDIGKLIGAQGRNARSSSDRRGDRQGS
jgi:hypothetical protein